MVNDYVEIPRELIEAQQGIILHADVMWIDGVPFLTTISQYLRFITVQYIPDRKAETLRAACMAAFVKYNNAGFYIRQFHADQEFDCIKPDLENEQIEVNIVPAQAHVPVIERAIRTIKERYRAMYHRAPYSMWPKLMIIHGATNAVKWLNTFHPQGGISTTYSPRTIITGRQIDFKSHCTSPFGSYVQAVTENAPRTNTPQERTIDAIFLRTLDNIQGGFEVLNLKTGHALTRHRVIELPVTEDVIKRVEQLAQNQGFQPHAEPTFRTYSLIAGVDDGNDEPPPHNDDEETLYNEDDDADYEPKLELEDDEPYEEEIDQQELVELQTEGAHIPGVDGPHQEDEEDDMPEPDLLYIADSDSEDEEEEDEQPAQPEQPLADNANEIQPEDPIVGPPEPRRTSRIPKPRVFYRPEFAGQRYKNEAVNHLIRSEATKKAVAEAVLHLITQVPPSETLEYTTEEATVLAHCFAQTYSLTKGLKLFKEEGKKAALKELGQLHGRECWRPIDVNKLSPHARRKAMRSLMFLTEKRDGSLKGRTVADGSTQRDWISKDQAASPTVALESILMTCVIDAKEGREVAIVDLPNAFIQTLNEKLHDSHEWDIMKISGHLADLLIEMQPEVYGPFATKERGVTVLYVEILRALYGMIKSPLLFYRKLRKDLESIGFKINPYDICVANKMVNGKQFTIVWHVDDLKCSHVETSVVDDFIEWARSVYEDASITVLKPSRGKVHDYLGMTIDYSEDGKVKIYMKDYIRNMLSEFRGKPEVDSMKKVSTPAASHLFTVNTKGVKLSDTWKDEFHTTVAKALFLCKRTRPDIQPTVPFLCTRVKEPDDDDWKKLLRMMKYLSQTVDLELTLEADGEAGVVLCKWYPDAAFAVHADCKSHTGAVLTLGKGAVNTISAKQKLNTRSSTEAELVAVDDVVVQAMWTRNFLEEQGYECKTTIYQDNTSAILLEKNGKESSSKRTRHINIRYFYITDCIAKQYAQVEYCPTDDMLGDFPSKPLQGRKFKKHRMAMMNLKTE